jgi:pimeloyl-ACP methyl ester carboxylesterase
MDVERVGTLPHVLIRALFHRYRIARALPTEHGVALYRVHYRTEAPDGRPVTASGLVALPRRAGAVRGVMGWLHGTTSLRRAAPSSKDAVNGLLPAAVFAGHGYALLAPDYLGFGISAEPHPYYVAGNTAAVVRDFVDAARTVVSDEAGDVPAKLLLAGFSQGGHATLATQRLLEAEPIAGLPLVASAPIAAAVDLRGLGLAGALAGGSRHCSLYVAWVATTYARTYGEPLTSVLREEWAEVATRVLDGEHDGDAVVAALPADPRAMLADSFAGAVDAGTAHWFLDRMQENSLLGWRPAAPVRIYFGEADKDVTPDQARLAESHFGGLGADVTAVSVGDLDHGGTVRAAVPLARAWFDEICASPSG